jgi:hypothetical protein
MRSGICLYNSSGQPHIPLRHPEIFPQYASEGRITKSAEDPTSLPPVGTQADWIFPGKICNFAGIVAVIFTLWFA